MKKTLETKLVTTAILDSAKSKLRWAISNCISKDKLIDLWGYMQNARDDLFVLSTIFFCEDEHYMDKEIKKIRSKLLYPIDYDNALQTAKECLNEINELEYSINKELEA